MTESGDEPPRVNPGPKLSPAVQRIVDTAPPAVQRMVETAPPPKPDQMGDPVSGASVLNIANYLTLVRLLLVPVFVVLLASHGGHSSGWREWSFVAFFIACVTDLIDGNLARSRNLVTDVGKIADPIADKTLTAAALLGLSALGDLPWWVTVVILGRELAITGLRFFVIRHGVIPASRGGKAKTFVQNVSIGFYLLPWFGWFGTLRFWVLGVALVLTLLTGGDYVSKAVNLRRNSERTAMKRRIRAGTESKTPASK